MSTVDYTPCSHCGVNNLPNRGVCWQCGTALPMMAGPDGRPRALTDSDRQQLRKAEIDALLDQAQTIDFTGGAKSRSSEDTPAPPSDPPHAWTYASETPSPVAVRPRAGRWWGLWSRRKRQPEA